MLGKPMLPMNYKMAILYFVILTMFLLFITWFLDKGASWYVNILFTMLCGVTDYLIFYRSIKKALKETPEKSLMVMREGTFIRFGVILIFGVVVECVDILNISTLLLGLVCTQAILILDGIIISLREGKKLNAQMRKEEKYD